MSLLVLTLLFLLVKCWVEYCWELNLGRPTGIGETTNRQFMSLVN